MLNKISALIITFNEEKNIKTVIESLDFVDEIIVVDSFSTDKTIDILKSFENIKIIQNKFSDYTSQRNLAIENAKNDWILFLDADERITPSLKQEIIDELAKPTQKSAYYFRRKFFYEQTPIHFSGTQTDKNFRLFNKNKAFYIPEKKVHETLKVTGEIGILKNKLLHYSLSNYENYKSKMIQYGKLKAKELFLKNKKYSFLKHYGKTFFRFFQTYFIRLGIFDGIKGFKLCYLQALTVYATFAELKVLEKNQNH